MATVLITGAAAGIGRAAALLFASQGWRCVLLDRDTARVVALADALPDPDVQGHMALCLDLLDPAGLAALADFRQPLDAVINNAGISDTRGLRLAEMAWAECQRLMTLNLQVPLAVLHVLQPCLAPRAHIVNVASGAAFQAIPWRGLYSASKAGLIAQSRALASEWPERCVSVLAPGFVRTELVQHLIDEKRLDPVRAVAKIPLGRMAEPEELAHALLFLASAPARLLGPEPLRVDGGSGAFGGSAAFSPAQVSPVSLSASTRLRLCGTVPLELEARLQAQDTGSDAGCYQAVVDFSVWQCASGELVAALHAAARQFVQHALAPSSLTLILPQGPVSAGAQAAGDYAAARMMVATLACELGPLGFRVNGLCLPPEYPLDDTALLINYVAGARAQFLTGQVLVLRTEQGA